MSTYEPPMASYTAWSPSAAGFSVADDYVGRHRAAGQRRAGLFRAMFYVGRHRYRRRH